MAIMCYWLYQKSLLAMMTFWKRVRGVLRAVFRINQEPKEAMKEEGHKMLKTKFRREKEEIVDMSN